MNSITRILKAHEQNPNPKRQVYLDFVVAEKEIPDEADGRVFDPAVLISAELRIGSKKLIFEKDLFRVKDPKQLRKLMFRELTNEIWGEVYADLIPPMAEACHVLGAMSQHPDDRAERAHRRLYAAMEEIS